MSTPLVKIAGKHLSLIDVSQIPEEGSLRIVSILGKARMGKSTFLNAILNRIGNSQKAFQTQDNDEHCTRGIDYYFCKEQRLLLLDCQGLSLEDSSHDPQLLLFAYLVSDIIIFNERMMLQNEALKLMEPICGFMTYIDMEGIRKPQLYFRISDADLVKDPKHNLTRVLTRYADQYQSIRDSIVHLFQPGIGIVKTESLDRSLKRALQDDNYAALFKDESLGFGSAIDTLIGDLPPGRSAKEWKGGLAQIIHGINHNEKITIDKLDVVLTLAKLEISDYIRAIPASFFADLSIDAFQTTYDRIVKPRIEAAQNLLADFERRFKSVSKEIKDTYLQELATRLATPIDLAKRQMTGLAEAQINHLVAAACRECTYPSLHNLHSSFTHTPYPSYLTGFQELLAAIEPLYEPVRTKYENWMKAQKRTLATAVQECIDMEAQNVIDIRSYIQGAIHHFEKGCLQRISTQTTVSIHEKAENILWQDPKALIDMYVADATKQLIINISKIVVPMSLLVTMSNRTVTVVKDYDAALRECVVQGHTTIDYVHPITYDLLTPLYAIWTDWIQNSPRIGALMQAVTDRKKELLFQALVDETVTRRVKDVDFVSLGFGGMRMTVDTFNMCYMPLVRTAIQQMDEKGYLIAGDAEDFVRVSVVLRNESETQALPWSFAKAHNLEIQTAGNVAACITIGSHAEPALTHLFKNVYSEVIALERAKKGESLYVCRKEFT
jgi:hypothetical protein